MDLRKFCSKCMASTGETSSRPTPKIQAVYASESELQLKNQNWSVDFEE